MWRHATCLEHTIIFVRGEADDDDHHHGVCYGVGLLAEDEHGGYDEDEYNARHGSRYEVL